MRHHNVSGVLFILSLIFFVSIAHSTTFDFNTDNQGWRKVGLYDGDSLDPIPGYFSDDPAPWSDVPGSGAIYLGSGGFTMPASPSGGTYLHWDLNSPDLSGNAGYQHKAGRFVGWALPTNQWVISANRIDWWAMPTLL